MTVPLSGASPATWPIMVMPLSAVGAFAGLVTGAPEDPTFEATATAKAVDGERLASAIDGADHDSLVAANSTDSMATIHIERRDDPAIVRARHPEAGWGLSIADHAPTFVSGHRLTKAPR